MRPAAEEPGMERSAKIETSIRRTAWIIAAVITALGLGAACFIAKSGSKSRTVLHSRLQQGMSREGVSSWT